MYHDNRVDNDIRKRMGKSLIFRYVGQERRDEILRLSEVLRFSEGDVIVREGDQSDHVFLVINGQVSVTVKDAREDPVYLCTIGEGEIFGEAGIFLKTARTANVVSLGEARVLRLHRKDLLDFIKRDPSTGIKVLMIIIYGLLKKLRETNQELAFERKADMGQEDIDDLVESLLAD